MKKSLHRLAALTLTLGLTACGNDDERMSEAEDPNRLESPAAGSPPADMGSDPSTQPGYGTGGSMGGTMGGSVPEGQNPDASSAMPSEQETSPGMGAREPVETQ